MSQYTTLAVLKAMRQRLTDERQWCSTDLARDINGQTVSPRSRDAVQWCLDGAAIRESPFTDVGKIENLLNRASHTLYPFRNFVAAQDALGYPAAMAILDAAIAAQESPPVEASHV